MAQSNNVSDFKINLIVLGSAGIGKTAIIKRYLNQPFNDTYNPTGVEQLSTVTKVGNASSRMRFFDIGAASIELEIVKKILDVCNLFLLCFSVTDEKSFEYIKNLWETKIKAYKNKEESFFCLIGLKNDLNSSNGNLVPNKSKFEQFSQQLSISYIECSAKNNEGVSMVFNSGLYFHYQRYLIKSISPIINNPIPKAELFSNNSSFRQIVFELFKFENKSIIQFLYNRCFDLIVDWFLLDISTGGNDACILSEFSGVFLDCKNEIVIRSIVNNSAALDKLFGTYFSKSVFSVLPISKQYHIVRLFINLFDSHFKMMSKYAKDTNLMDKLLSHANDESKYQLLNIILQTEKKIRSLDISCSGESCLLQGINLGQHFERLLTCDSPMISLSESIFKLVLQTQDTNFSGILNTFSYKNYTIITTLLDLMKDPETCNDAVSFFCSLLGVHSRLSEEVSSEFMSIISDNQLIFTTLIESPSKILQYNALKLTYNFLQHSNCEIFAKPLLLPCLDIFFICPRSNVLHFLISQIIQCVLKFPNEEFPTILLNKGELTNRILKTYKSRLPAGTGTGSGGPTEHFGYLINIAKWIMESPHGSQDAIVLGPKWKKFYQNFVMESIQKQGLLPPTIELRDQNHKSKTALYSGEAI